MSANTGFMKLKEAGLEAGFSEKFDGGVEAIISSAQSLSSALQSQIEECRVADLETEKVFLILHHIKEIVQDIVAVLAVIQVKMITILQ